MTTAATGRLRVTGIDTHTYLVKDTARAVAFYRDTLGLTPTFVSDDGAEFDLDDGSTFTLWKPHGMPWERGTGVMFAVDDFPAAVETAKARGATIHMATETPVCHIAMGEDTEGNQLILHQRKPHDH